jgi:hypothetical protein
MQPHSMTSVMQLLVTFSALVIAACAGFLTYWNVREHRNADLVKIGVSVLRVDPEKEKQLSQATREWALDLIDANAGGVTFSSEARAQLLKEPLKYSSTYGSGFADGTYGSGVADGTYGSGTVADGYPAKPDKSAPRRPSPEPPK